MASADLFISKNIRILYRDLNVRRRMCAVKLKLSRVEWRHVTGMNKGYNHFAAVEMVWLNFEKGEKMYDITSYLTEI